MLTLKHHIADFEQFVRLFKAGHGEFYLWSTKSGTVFCLKFTTRHTHWSKLQLCFTQIDSQHQLVWVNFGRYDFKDRILQISSSIDLNRRSMSMLYQTLDFVLRCMNSGQTFSDALQVYYSGHCCRCGQLLTDGESLKQGFGDECLKKLKHEQPLQQFVFF